ncbi:MAG: arabinan endo-1,5-alpha-L-arabinosidase [Caldilineaceae bacterium]
MRLAHLSILITLLVAACTSIQANPPANSAAAQATAMVALPSQASTGIILDTQGEIQQMHDPVMTKEGDTYYIFSTGSRIIIHCSKDMVHWTWCGRVFERNPSWVRDLIGLGDLWAPDISFFAGKWHLYYAVSTFGSQRSVIGLATNVTLDQQNPQYKWVDEGAVLASQPGGDWNAIDPNLAFDADNQPWLAFGSYWSGIKLRKMDATTGKLAADDDKLYALASRERSGGTDAIEGAFIIRRGAFYYLFVSFDFCCRGADSTYNVRIGRATQITGPYIDSDGKPMMEGGGTRLISNYGQWHGPGHNGIFQENDTYWIVYHAYDALEVGIPKVRIEALTWDAAGWPHAPSAALAP